MTLQQTSMIRPAQAVSATSHVIVIGGGASGAVMATHLLTQSSSVRVTIIEAQNEPGRGLAYSTSDPDHLLNTRAHNMSAFPDDPDHFSNWMRARAGCEQVTANCFVSRMTYGSYISGLLDPWKKSARLKHVNAVATGLSETRFGIRVALEDGKALTGDIAILATGYGTGAGRADGDLLGPLDEAAGLDPEARVVIVGSGLSMVDRVVSLRKAGHKGEIVAVSRRGLLPRSHAACTPMPIDLADIPLGCPISELMQWLRRQAILAEQRGGTWRDAVDGLKPHASAIWRALPIAERSRFLRHAVIWWDVHRHRIPPQSDEIIKAAIADGQLRLQRGSFTGVARSEGVQSACVARRDTGEIQQIAAAAIFDCRGRLSDSGRRASPLMTDFIDQGLARIDPLQIGLEVDESCGVISAGGVVSDRIFAIGPASRSAFWEITAMPDIREQTARLAERVTERLSVKSA